MFEVGMSALVLKICSEYAKSLGLNFPPCTQQEINAICEWVDKHTIKDMTISQDGYNVTFTFKTENDTIKEFTFTIPKKVDIDELEKVLVGSENVVVVRSEDNSKLQVRLDQSVINDINSKLAKPANPASESVVTMTANGTVGTKPLSEIGGGKLYLHKINLMVENLASVLVFYLYNRISTKMTLNDIVGRYFLASMTAGMYTGVVSCIIRPSTTEGSTHKLTVDGVVAFSDNTAKVIKHVEESGGLNVSDTVTEL